MGIRHLNKFLRTNCPNSIACINMKEISGKKIAIDVSIYLYKFAADNTLIENMYLMLSIFRYYQIIPVFVFDGKPPDEKKQVLEKRKSDKVQAKK
jgi:flap endonuclease-1